MKGHKLQTPIRTSNTSAVNSAPAHYQRNVTYSTWSDELKKVGDNTKYALIEPQRLWLFLSRLFCSSLDNSLVQLQCLDKCNNELNLIKALAVQKKIKYGINNSDEPENVLYISKEELNSTANKVEKLEADRNYVINVIEKMYLELTLHQTFNLLRDFNNEFVRREDYRNELGKKESKNKQIRKEVCKQIRQQRNYFKSKLYEIEANIEKLTSNVKESQLVSETCYRYVEKWQVARSEQNTKMIIDIENNPTTNTIYFKQRTAHEHRVHSEVETLVNIIIEETMEKIEKWMDKYDKDIETIDLKIQLQKNKYYDTQDVRIAMETEVENRNMLMKNWIHFKIDREKARLYQVKMISAATAVQSWWRGLLVRLKLGPYKEKKVKRAKSKNNPH